MSQSFLILCQGLHISKIIASILSHSPRECIILRSYYDISDKLSSDIETAISSATDYIDSHISFFPSLMRIWEIEADIFNPFSIIKSLESIEEKSTFSHHTPFIDLSSGTIPANIGLYLFAIRHKLAHLSFCFPGERFEETEGLSADIKLQKEIEFSRKHRYDIPLIKADFSSFDEEILFSLSRIEGNKVNDLKTLSEILNREYSQKVKMSLSRHCDQLNTLGLITSRKIGNKKEISLTPSGIQYTKHSEYSPPTLRLRWTRKE